MDFLGGLLSGASNLIGGFFNRQSAQDVNQQNLAASMFQATHGIRERVADAKAAGINPLAALGFFTPGSPTLVGDNSFGESIGAAGQDISRAITAGNPQVKRQQELESQLLEAKIANVNADTVRQQAEASSLVRRFASPGTAPSVSVPLPTASPFTRDTLPLFQDYRDDRGGRLTLLSPDASQAVMNAASLPAAVPIGAGLVGRNIPNLIEGARTPPVEVSRPDVFRNIDPAIMQSMY